MVNDKPKVSVVMGVFNGAGKLSKTVNSILRQKGASFEFVIVDDGSNDGTADELDRFMKSDSRVRVLRHEENLGLTQSLIIGCEAARGDFIARQDCGDISLDGRLSRQTALLEAFPECSFVACWTRVVGPEGEFLHTSKGTGAATQPIQILSNTAKWGVLDGPPHHSSVMMRKNAYMDSGGYRPEFYYGQDWDLWYRIAEIGKFAMINARLCEAQLAPGSISTSRSSLQSQYAEQSFRAMRLRREGFSDKPALETAGRILRRKDSRNQKKRNLAQAEYVIARALMKNNDRRALKYLVRSFFRYPMYLRTWIALLVFYCRELSGGNTAIR